MEVQVIIYVIIIATDTTKKSTKHAVSNSILKQSKEDSGVRVSDIIIIQIEMKSLQILLIKYKSMASAKIVNV